MGLQSRPDCPAAEVIPLAVLFQILTYPTLAMLCEGIECETLLMHFSKSALLLMLAGCAFWTQPAAAEALSTGTITDPTLGDIKAFTVTIPSGWKFQGTVVRGPECNPISYPAFRTYSSDGLTEMRLLPAFNWSFHPAIQMKTAAGCLPLQQTLSASQFLDHFIELLPGGVHVAGSMGIAASYQERLDKYAANMNANTNGVHATVDAAALRVETVNGSFVIENRIRAWVECRTNSQGGKFNGGGCSAHVDVLRAPKGKLDALVAVVDAHDLTKVVNDPQWLTAIMQRQQREAAARMTMMHETQARQSAMLRSQYEQIQATLNRNHAAFMAQQESQFRSAMNNANNAMNARTTAASDWVDYALDQQTVTGSGGTVKVSNAYSQTWSNGQNQWYQTNNANANPNGVLPGNWTQNTKVHGNGQPR